MIDVPMRSYNVFPLHAIWEQMAFLYQKKDVLPLNVCVPEAFMFLYKKASGGHEGLIVFEFVKEEIYHENGTMTRDSVYKKIPVYVDHNIKDVVRIIYQDDIDGALAEENP